MKKDIIMPVYVSAEPSFRIDRRGNYHTIHPKYIGTAVLDNEGALTIHEFKK